MVYVTSRLHSLTPGAGILNEYNRLITTASGVAIHHHATSQTCNRFPESFAYKKLLDKCRIALYIAVLGMVQ